MALQLSLIIGPTFQFTAADGDLSFYQNERRRSRKWTYRQLIVE